jgi:membrane-associated phospholipid phosphatase
LLFAWPLVRRRTRILLAVYVAAMLFALVYGGEHYVTDVLVGYVYAAGSVVGVSWWFRRHEADATMPRSVRTGASRR